MKKEKYPTDLTDNEWNNIKEVIPEAKKGGRPRRVEIREVINAIIYVAVGGFNHYGLKVHRIE